MENSCKYVWNKKTVTTVFCPTSWWSIVENLTLLYAYIWNEKSKFSYNPWYSHLYTAQLIFPCMICLLPYLLLYGGNFWYIYSFFLISCIIVTVSFLFHVYMWQFPYYIMYICDSFLLIPGIIVTVSFLFHV